MPQEQATPLKKAVLSFLGLDILIQKKREKKERMALLTEIREVSDELKKRGFDFRSNPNLLKRIVATSTEFRLSELKDLLATLKSLLSA